MCKPFHFVNLKIQELSRREGVLVTPKKEYQNIRMEAFVAETEQQQQQKAWRTHLDRVDDQTH